MAAGDITFIGGRKFISRGERGKETISKSEARKRLKKSSSKRKKENKKFPIYDSKTGKFIRYGSFGDSIAEAKLSARAEVVKKTIKPKKLSDLELKSRKGQKLEEIAIPSQIKQLQQIEIQKQAREAKSKFFKEAREKREQKRLELATKLTKARTKEKEIKPVKQKFSQTELERKEVKRLSKLIKPTKTEKNIISGQNIEKKQFQQLKNLPKNVATGLFEAVKEIVVDPVVDSYNFGKNLRKRFEKGENNPLFNDIKKLSTGTVAVAKFIKDKPKESLAIVGLAVSSGGKEFGTALSNNPVKTLTKSAVYLFPGTIIKGGVKSVGLGIKGTKTVIQAKRLVSIEKIIKPARASLTLKQTLQVNKAIGKISKISSSVTRNNKLSKLGRGITKAGGLKIKRGSSPKSIFNSISKLKQKEKLIAVSKKGLKKVQTKEFLKKSPKIKGSAKKQPKRPKSIVEIKNGKVVKVTKVSKLPPKKPITKRDTTKFFSIENGKLKKITKKEFTSKEFRISTKKQPKRPVKFIDLNKKKVTKVSTKSQLLKTKGIFKGKKAQGQFQRMLNKDVSKIKTKVKKLKKLKKPSKSVLKSTKNDLTKLRLIALEANVNNIIRSTILLKEINKIIKDINKIDTSTTPAKATTPKKGKAQSKTKTPAKDRPSKRAREIRSKTPDFIRERARAKGKTKAKPTPEPLKPKIKKPKKIKKKLTPKKTTRRLKLPINLNFDTKLPRGQRLRFDMKVRIKGKTKVIPLGLPLNKAIAKAGRLIDNTTSRSMQLIISGTTKQKDIAKPKVLSKFRTRKTKKVLLLVEKTKNAIDTSGEKRGLTIGKALSSRKKKKVAKNTSKSKKSSQNRSKKKSIKKK